MANFEHELRAVVHLHASPTQAIEQYLETPSATCMCGADIPPPGDPADMCPACRADLPRRRERHAASLARGRT